MSRESFAKAVRSGQFVISAECRPPRGAASDRLKACAAAIGGSVNAIYAPESEDGARLGSLAACSHLAGAGAEPILNLLTRDLNRIALQSVLLGAASMGVSNVLCTSGRHQALTSSRAARGVFDVDPVQLLQVADAMRKQGVLADGQSLDAPVSLFLGADTNPFAEPLEMQVITLEKAVRAGADFVITQPVFDFDKFSAWMNALRERGIPERTCIIASVMPLTSAQDIEIYPNLDVPDAVVEKLKTAPDPKAAGATLAAKTAKQLRGIQGVRGIHLMTGDNFELAAEIIRASGISGS